VNGQGGMGKERERWEVEGRNQRRERGQGKERIEGLTWKFVQPPRGGGPSYATDRGSQHDAARSLLHSGAGSRYRRTSAAAPPGCRRDSQPDRQTYGQTDGHSTVTQTLSAARSGRRQ